MCKHVKLNFAWRFKSVHSFSSKGGFKYSVLRRLSNKLIICFAWVTFKYTWKLRECCNLENKKFSTWQEVDVSNFRRKQISQGLAFAVTISSEYHFHLSYVSLADYRKQKKLVSRWNNNLMGHSQSQSAMHSFIWKVLFPGSPILAPPLSVFSKFSRTCRTNRVLCIGIIFSFHGRERSKS